MTSEIIAIASDHAGFELKSALQQELIDRGYDILNLGTNSLNSADYPDFGYAMADALKDGHAARVVLVCGSGIGMSIAANRFAGVRAALVHDEEAARQARQHNDANVLVMGARKIKPSVAEDCLDVFLTTPFEGGRHQRRVYKLA